MRAYQGEIQIDGVTLWDWVIKNFTANDGDELVFGIPVWCEESQSLKIEYAGCDECSPMNWADKPSFISDKK
jgi:hypothetical protein